MWPHCWNVPGGLLDVVQQLLFPGGPSWWKGGGASVKGSNLKNQRASYRRGSAVWPTYSASSPRELIKWCLGMQAGWVYAPLLPLQVSSVTWGGK